MERIWGALGSFPPDYQHVLTMLPQTGIVLEEVHNQRALPINVEEVGRQLRAFAGWVRLSRRESGKNYMLSLLQHGLRNVKVIMFFVQQLHFSNAILKKLPKVKKKDLSTMMLAAEISTIAKD